MPSPLRKAIFLAQENPYQRSTGRQIRDTYLIQLLMESLEVELFSFVSAQETAALSGHPGAPERLKAVALPAPRMPLWKKTLFPLLPREVGGRSPEVESLIRARAHKAGETLLWISGLGMAQYVPVARRLGYRTIVDEYRAENPVFIEDALSSTRGFPEALRATQRRIFEGRFCRQSHAVVTTSDLDASRIHRIAPGSPVHVIPNSVEFETYGPLRESSGSTLLFPGSLDSPANLEGLRWFIASVLPRLKASLGPNLPRIVAAGANPSADTVRMLRAAGVEVQADPPSILPFLAEAAVVFFPIRSHGAMRFRILEAMAAGKAVVATGRGAEGLVLSPGFDIWISDRADAFTSDIHRLLEDPGLRATTGRNAARTVETRYDWRQVRALLETLLESLSRTAVPERENR